MKKFKILSNKKMKAFIEEQGARLQYVQVLTDWGASIYGTYPANYLGAGNETVLVSVKAIENALNTYEFEKNLVESIKKQLKGKKLNV